MGLTKTEIFNIDRVMKKRVIILGGGISGLSLAWYLSQYPEQFESVSALALALRNKTGFDLRE